MDRPFLDEGSMATGRAQKTTPTKLQELAGLYGILTAYDDAAGHRCEASRTALLRMLNVMGVPLERAGDAAGALRERRQELWRRVLEPVALAWDGRPQDVPLRLPGRQAAGRVACRLRLEGGEERRWDAGLDELPT